MKKAFLMLTVALMLPMALLAQSNDPMVVATESGLVKGFDHEGTMGFLGIPYAKVERFMPPMPVDKWDTVRICDHWGPQVMQNTYGRKLSEAEMSEKNSCVLNVWTTDTKAKKPVMLWLHGGGFDSGTSAWNPGMCLAKKDVVVVSINHRLNILGFLDLSACSAKYKDSGNVGMLDVVQALQWIQKNIKQFGGDPGNVTVFGESGGGGKVGTLMCMPAAKGLFHKAIIMSGTILNVNNKAMTEQLGMAVLKELGIDKEHIDRIKDVPYDELYAAGQRAMAASIGTRKPGTPMMWGFGPTPDGVTLLQQPFQDGFPEISADVPVLIGTTFNELQRLRYDKEMTTEEAKAELSKTFGDETDAYVAAFDKTYPGHSPQDLLSIDWLFRPKTIITADEIAESRRAKTYMYMFTWRSPVNNGSVHGHELKFCFNTLHHAANELPQPTDEDRRLADTMSTVWAQFAKTGNPNVQGLPQWRNYTKENGEMMVFDYQCRIKNNPDRELEQIINRHCFKQLDELRKNMPLLKTHVETGDIEGVLDGNDLAIYKAIPYAAPPVGDLRWREPQPPKPWTGVLKANEFGPWPPQPTRRDGSKPKMSEDCLYLGIATPAKSKDEKLPVMVWIHGGGFQTEHYGGDLWTSLARRGVVIVSVEYRTGALGFMAHPELAKESPEGHSGNYGILDQIYALKWVQRNIANFGGDPSKVTIFGESAGAISCSILCGSPLTKGLFRAAISQSGGSFAPWSDSGRTMVTNASQKGAEQQGLAFQKHLKKKSIKQMRKMDALELCGDNVGFSGFWPCVDGYVITDDLYRNYERGDYNDVPVIVMTNSDEGAMFTWNTVPTEEYKKSVRNVFGKMADEALKLYPGNTEEEAYFGNGDMFRDMGFAWPSFAWASLQSKTGKSPAYAAFLAQPSEVSLVGNKKRHGVSHADDILYLNGTFLSQPEKYPAEAAVAEIIQEYWVNFAKTGNPNSKGLPYWPVFDKDKPTTMQFSNGASLIMVPNREQIDFIDRFYQWKREETEAQRK